MPNRPQKNKKTNNLRTPLEGHTRDGTLLIPPMAKMGMKASSWMNDRLPEMVWAALLIAALGREAALGVFRKFLSAIGQHAQRDDMFDVTLTGLAKLPSNLRISLLEVLVGLGSARHALSPLLLFTSLPARSDWEKYLNPPGSDSLDLLMRAVGLTLYHQTQEATDCRWVRLTAQLVSGRLQMPKGDLTKWLLEYPNYGEQNEVRPFIRAAEIAPSSLEPPNLTWPKAFWCEAWERTPCFAYLKTNGTPVSKFSVTAATIDEIVRKLEIHWEETHSTTAIDAKHDAVFGITFYCLRIFRELLQFDGTTALASRLALRSMIEARVTLRHLMKENKDELWLSWRVYGAGQAKLNSLKLEDNLPSYLSPESLEQIANEDVMQEFVTINLGHWANSDFRKIAIACGLKDLYDRYYSWTSGFAHAQWGAVRETVFETCANPLHRLHRYPSSKKPLNDMTSDAVLLVDAVLGELNLACPVFSARVGNASTHG